MSSQTILERPDRADYSLTGANTKYAIENGLAEAEWYQSPIPRAILRGLLERRDGPAVRDTFLWIFLIVSSALLTWYLWPSLWAIAPYFVYTVLYGTTSDSRWHESGHGTAFKTDWLNNVLYELSSFMVMRESTLWRWSHVRHHSDTIIVGRDPEIVAPRPPNLMLLISSFFGVQTYRKHFPDLLRHACGRLSAQERTFVPASEFQKVFVRARLYLAIYAAFVVTAVATHSILPLLFVGLPNLFGTWLMLVYGVTQHTGLAENVLDHRLNCRTVYMNPLNRYLYWNMNYHVEHHMYPLVPYHALPALHEAIKSDCAEPYNGLLDAWREIIPAILRQVSDPAYYVRRKLPEPETFARTAASEAVPSTDAEGWIDVGDGAVLQRADVLRFDYGRKTFALYRDESGALYATDGICTHGNVHLSAGLVKGTQIECSKHNGRFSLIDGSAARVPACRGLTTYPLEERGGRLHLNVVRASGAGVRKHAAHKFRVVSNSNVATFIKELVLEPLDGSKAPDFSPGDYLQFDIPAYGELSFRDFDIPEPYATVWRQQHVFDLGVKNDVPRRNNYSLGSNRTTDSIFRFNIRIATPPPGQECSPGIGSSYIFSLKPGDLVSAIGPFGDFHIKPTQREMLYIGGGAGMAPLRAHLSHLLETEDTGRRINFWYGARSYQEIFYRDYFEGLEAQHSNFKFHLALSSPLPEDRWAGHTGFIHDVVRERQVDVHANPAGVEYYLCGPPMMIRACVRMLSGFGVPPDQIAYDEF